MKIVHINTYSHGGAATSAMRIKEALNQSGITADMINAQKYRWPFYAERLAFLPYEKDKSVRFQFSLANFGIDISKYSLIKNADIIHLHWINQGFLSVKGIERLIASGKPIVWSLHDMWPFTGGCHYSGDCKNFKAGCGNCKFLKNPSVRDLSFRVLQSKNGLKDINFIASSNWLTGLAKKSSLLFQSNVTALHTPINTDLYKRNIKINTGKNAVLFAASKISEPRKGFRYFLEALRLIKKIDPNRKIEVHIAGKTDLQFDLPYPVIYLGDIKAEREMVSAYSNADVFVIPSVEDNLPNTVLESLSCGCPVVGFDTGGIPEMVTHLNDGYICRKGDAMVLADGILYALNNKQLFSERARQKAESKFSYPIIGKQYIDFYQSLI